MSKIKVLIKLVEFLQGKTDGKPNSSEQYWDQHLTKGGLIRMRVWCHLYRKYEAYKKLLHTEPYKSMFYTESHSTKLVLPDTEELMEYLIKKDMLQYLKLDETKLKKEQEYLLHKFGATYEHSVSDKITAITTMEKYLETKKLRKALDIELEDQKELEEMEERNELIDY